MPRFPPLFRRGSGHEGTCPCCARFLASASSHAPPCCRSAGQSQRGRHAGADVPHCVRMTHCTRPSWRWATGAQRPTRSMRRSMSDNMSTSLLFFPSIRSHAAPHELCGAARRTTWVRCDASPTPRRVVQHAAPLLQPGQLGANAKMCRVGSAAAGRQR